MMKQEPRNFDETPYPRLGEVVHFVVHAFGLFGGGDDLRKRLKRFASESDFNLVTANQLIDEALLKPLKKVDAKFAGDMREWLTKLLDDYKTIVLAIPTETANRDVVLAVLARRFFIPSITIFLKTFQQEGPNSPNLEPWFKSTDTIAIKEVLSWRLQTVSAEEVLIKFLNSHGTKNDSYESIFRQLRRWKSGETLPDMTSLLNLNKQAGKPQNDLTQLVIWLLLARAWQYICQSVVKRLGEKMLAPFVSLVGSTYQKALEKFKAEEFVKDLPDHFFQDDFMPAISLESEKTAGDEIQAQTILKDFKQHELYPHYRYFSELGWARYYAMLCDYKQALEHYQAAFKHGAYRAGKSLYSILRELLTLAAFLSKKEVINRHYRWACAMGLFSENHNQPTNWEIKQFKMAFFKQFPLYGLYQCVEQQKKTEREQEQKKSFFSGNHFG
jgi:tetratricopeptide (TPR) repeat protein